MTEPGLVRRLEGLYRSDNLGELRRQLADNVADLDFLAIYERAIALQFDRRYDLKQFAWNSFDRRLGRRRDDLLSGLLETGAARGRRDEDRRAQWRAEQTRPYLTIVDAAPRFPVQVDFIKLYRDFGLPAVDTIVVPLSHGPTATRCIGVVTTRTPDRCMVAEVTQLVAAYYLKSRLCVDEEARPSPEMDRSAELSTDQLRVLRWAAAGKTMHDTAAITGMSYRKVRYLMDRARSRYGFATVQQTIVRAALDYGFDPLGGDR